MALTKMVKVSGWGKLLRGVCVSLSFLSLPLLATERTHSSHQVVQSSSCVASGSWLSPGEEGSIDEVVLLERTVANRVVLLGEHHDNQAHHDWQLRMLQLLHQKQPQLVMGLEMLPKVAQPKIDRFLQGKTTIETFLKEVEWQRYWSFSADYYAPLLKYARDKKIPVVALNVTRDKVEAAVEQGWGAVPVGMTQPAQPTRPYLRHLISSFQRHQFPGAELHIEIEGPAFRRFVQKQLLWDRAMAEGVRAQLDAPQRAPLVVAFIGSGHLMYDFGVPHQLQSLGIEKVMTMIPWDSHLDCSVLKKGFADIVYGAE